MTVEGSQSQLCPVPDIAPVSGLCDIIIEGDTSALADACCPRGLTMPSSVDSWIPPANYFRCVPDLPLSPFSMQLSSVSDIFGSGSDLFSNYTLKVGRVRVCLSVCLFTP